jgi:hypothetical protein
MPHRLAPLHEPLRESVIQMLGCRGRIGLMRIRVRRTRGIPDFLLTPAIDHGLS